MASEKEVTPTRNSEVLESFVAYCRANPEQRFWQALRNWSGYGMVFVADYMVESPYNVPPLDTFSWEGKRHDEKG